MPVLDPNELDTRSKYHPPTDEKRAVHEEVRALYTEMAQKLNDLLPASSEAYKAMEYLLDNSLMLANAAIARRM